MATIDNPNDTIHPKSKSPNSEPVKWSPNFTNFRKLAPNMTGIARKKVNSAATSLEIPINKAPIIVAPDLEVPGINANI